MFASKDTLLTRPSGGYNIARSVRLRRSATGNFSRTPASASNRQTWTWSGWVKRGDLTNENLIFGSRPSAGTYTQFSFRNSGSSAPFCLLIEDNVTGNMLVTTQVFRDPSAWYHIVVAMDTTQATSSNRAKLYVNGVQVTSLSTANYPAQNANLQINNTAIHNLGADNSDSAQNFDGYMAEVNFVDGQQLTPSSFGETDSITGVWKPKKYSGTYGTNGFYLNFSDNSNNTAATIGKDYSGNGNNWTPNNISVTAGVTYDSMVDSPTVGATSSNYCVINPLDTQNTSSVAQGNQYISFSAVNYGHSRATMSIPDGSYWEVVAGGTDYLMLGVANSTAFSSFNWAGSWAIYQSDGKVYNNGAAITGVLATFTTNDVIGFAVKGNKLYIAKNNTWLNSGNPVAQTGSVASSLSSEIFPYIGNGGGAAGTPSAYFNAGQRPFSYTPPTGYVALNTYNLPASTITNGAAYMAATTYTGTGSAQNITNSGSFQPDWVWIKNRGGAFGHGLVDSVRGRASVLYSNDTAAQGTSGSTQDVTAFNSNGFALGTNSQIECNANGNSYIGWQWKAGGTSASNTNGTITSTVSAGATQGFSVATYTGNGSAGATFGHGLGVAPSFVIIKERGNVNGWLCYHISTGNTGYLELDATLSFQTLSTVWNNTTPSSSVVTLGTVSNVNRNGGTFVAYCFAAVAGYSAFGSYTGNGSTDGTFVYLGFRPKFVLFRSTSASRYWVIRDTSRDTFNTSTSDLYPNTADSTGAGADIDILSNGFKLRATSATFNGSGETYIYAAFAEVPFKSALGR
jgi:hypothetical protein